MEIVTPKTSECTHYQSKCQIKAPCCNIYYSCRLCHDENYEFKKGCQVTRMDRYNVKQIRCKNCEHEQDPRENCEKCSTKFARYFCSVCNLYEDNKKKNIYHCSECGICRIGIKEDVIHCKKCDSCIPKDNYSAHYCKKSDRDEQCAVCLEDFFYNRKPKTFFGQCMHPIHNDCLMGMLKANSINCPVCGRSYSKESDDQIEYIDMMVEETKDFFNVDGKAIYDDILCLNCMEKTFKVQYNYYGMKCSSCGSYNTKRIA